MKTIKTIAACALLISASASFAHETAPHGAGHAAPPAAAVQQAWGIAAPPRAAQRTVTVRMTDAMRFEPSQIEVREGETLRLRVENTGQVMHEMVLGTAQSLAAHAAMMRHHPGMPHSEAYLAHVAPGRSGDISWTFNRPGRFEFACLVAGHFEAGMTGTLTVVPAHPSSTPHERKSL